MDKPSLGRNNNSRRSSKSAKSKIDQPTLGSGTAMNIQPTAKSKSSKQPERQPIAAGLRFQVLQQDNYRCRICGASANDGAKLEVDHIVPVSRGGTNDPTNLQTLCDKCNVGKSNRLL